MENKIHGVTCASGECFEYRDFLRLMANLFLSRAESYKNAITCCTMDETVSISSCSRPSDGSQSTVSAASAEEYVEQLSFWQKPRHKVDLVFRDLSYTVKVSKKCK